VLVVHGIWAYGAVQLWAEDPALPVYAPPRAGRPSRAPRRHPFAADAAELGDTLVALGAPAADLARKAVDDELTLRLPTVGDGPRASPELTRPHNTEPSGEDRRPGNGRPSVGTWRVPVLTFEPDAAAGLLTVLAGAQFAELTPGGSIGYLCAAASFAADLAARGRVLPVLVPEEDGYAARWRPVLAAADAQRARELAAAMPPLCRAAEDTPAGTSLAGMLDSFADSTVRTRLRTPLLPARRGRRPARIDLAERTVAALTTSDARVTVETPQDAAEAQTLATSLAAWLADAHLVAGPVRTCFRLAEPPEPNPADSPAPDPPTAGEAGISPLWRAEFALQSAEDPSLMLTAEDVWAGAGTGWLAGDERPDELLLAGLGTAARLFPELEDALREPAPTAVALDTAGALEFLRETGPLLAGAGFGVLLPDWARKARLGLKLTTKSSTSSSPSSRQSAFGLQDLVEFRYDLAVGDNVLTADELAELAALKVPLVRVRGQWVELDERHLKTALKFLERNQSGTMTAADVLQAEAHGPADGVPVTVDADGWLGDLLSGQADRRLPPLGTPPGFRGELRPYQQRGLAWLSFLGELGLGAVLADDMGLGKTVQLLALLSSEGTATPRAPGCGDGGDGNRAVLQDHSAGMPDVAGGELAARSPAVYPGTPGAYPPRGGPAGRRRTGHGAGGRGPGDNHLRDCQQGPGRAEPGAMAPRGSR
jgi:SNF2 Helicase protein/SNF2-related domain